MPPAETSVFTARTEPVRVDLPVIAATGGVTTALLSASKANTVARPSPEVAVAGKFKQPSSSFVQPLTSILTSPMTPLGSLRKRTRKAGNTAPVDEVNNGASSTGQEQDQAVAVATQPGMS